MAVPVDGRGVGGVDRGGEHGCYRVDLAGHAAQVELGGVAVEAEVLLGDGEADERRAVHLAHQLDRLEDADDGEPVAPEPHLGGVGQVVDAEDAGRVGAEHHGRVVGGGGVEERAVGQAGAEGGGQGGVGGGDRDAAGVDGGNERVAVDVGARDRSDFGDVGDGGDPRDHPLGGGGQLGALAEGALAGLHVEQVAELAEFVQQTRIWRIGRCRARRRWRRCRC